MCVRRVRPFSKRTRRFFPRALTSSMRSPTGPRPRRALWNCFTRAPTSALRSAVAARKMVSPSGIFLFPGLGRLSRRRLAPERRALEITLDPRSKSRLLERGRERRCSHLFAVDPRDQERLAPALLDQSSQGARQGASGAAPFRLFVGEERLEVLLAAPEPTDQRAVMQDHLGTRGPL